MDKRIKILRVITRIDVGGISQDIINLSEKLDPETYEQAIVYGPSQLKLKFNFPKYEINELKRSISPLNDIKSLLKIKKIINEYKPDIVHSHSSKAGFVARWAVWLSKQNNIKVIHTPHGHVFYGYEFSWLKTKIFLFLEKITAKITDKLIALTEGEKNESLHLGIGKPNQWEIIHSGVDVKNDSFDKQNARQSLNIESNALVIGTVARLEPVKGIEYFIRAIPAILNEVQNDIPHPVIFLIVGDGNQKSMLEKLAETYNISKHVIFAGMRKNVLEIMSSMDIYIQPSLNEGMGKTLIQAFSLGLPIIATKVQGIPDIVHDNKNGILIKPKDTKSLSEAVVKLAFNESLRKTYGNSGANFVKEKIDNNLRFSSDRMINLTSNLYKGLLNA